MCVSAWSVSDVVLVCCMLLLPVWLGCFMLCAVCVGMPCLHVCVLFGLCVVLCVCVLVSVWFCVVGLVSCALCLRIVCLECCVVVGVS